MVAQVGKKAPLFELPSSTGERIGLKSYEGRQTVVLYFYPKDATSGCTREACDFRDSLERVRAAGAEVLGVSPDSVASHFKFVSKERLNFPLLADEDHAVCEKYGVWVKKRMYGREYMGVERTTFLIDRQGVIANVWNKVSVPGHVAEVLAALRELEPRGEAAK